MYSGRIVRVERHSSSVATLYLDINIPSYPGQFVMINLPGCEEIPLSLSSQNTVTVKAVGDTTRELVNSQEGRRVGIRGAFGTTFTPSDNALLIAGGIGIAPLRYLYNYLKNCQADVKVIYGVRTAEDLIWLDEFENVVVTTEDGSTGIKGTVIDAMKREDLASYSRIYVCGSEQMMRAAFTLLKAKSVLEKSEFSLERFMRCAIGVCGSCVVEGGLRVCSDGPVFSATNLPW
ncbi:dihydroorotate dehydrogenase electron transfer subunit [Archaeoglobus neptunius]|uniref:dihydroorotate dehydrogenase electron transfer subunit n=1 Tax=Archaeoglobus neptunius TaxID=2798580 RepID=UPI0019285E3D